VSRPFPSWNRSILTEIYLCHACSHPEVEGGNARVGSCGQEHSLADYCNEPAVRRALHVPSLAQIGPCVAHPPRPPDHLRAMLIWAPGRSDPAE
jgi:hypothetical protein